MVRVYRGGFHPFRPMARQWNRQLEEWRDALPDLADRVLNQHPFPAVNAWDEGNELLAEAELPGVKSEDLEVTVVGGELTIKGQRPEVKEEGFSYHRRERGTGAFTRVLRLPVDVDAERVEATLRDGVLTIRLPKAEAAKPRKINVQAK